MARIRYDGNLVPSNFITYTDIPNILKFEDTGGGTKATITVSLTGNLQSATDTDGEWYISILGETITNVTEPENAVSKNFYISSGNTSTAASVCRALRNCSTIAANFNVLNSGSSVVLTAKAVGPILSTGYYDTNILQQYISITGTDGTASSSYFGAKIDVDVYSDGEYITTLEKNYYGSEVAFNLSPVLATISEVGKSTPYDLKVSYINRYGTFGQIGTVSTNYSVVGYMVNQGYKYNIAMSDTVLAQNVLRGNNRDTYNNSLLYVYEPTIYLSFYTSSATTKTLNVTYRDSSFNAISSFSSGFTTQGTDNILNDVTIELNPTYLKQSFYVDVQFADTSNVIRYNVIKPLKMTEFCQRVYFRNSYGGVSFFDFTGQKSETRDLDLMTYEKNIFDYYSDPMNELEKIYDNTVKYSVTLKSHLFEKDGKYIFNDMLQSPELWVMRNGEKYAIILDNVSVDETTNNDIYEATIRFRYSQEPSLI